MALAGCFAIADDPRPNFFFATDDQQRELKHDYSSVSFSDAHVGCLMDERKTPRLADKTTAVLWSDHGWKPGDHNRWCKQTNYEIDARVPLVIRDPRAKANREISQSLVELVDVSPTLCDLSGLSVPEHPEKGEKKRPTIAFVNNGKEPVTLYWLPEGGDKKEVGVLKPGKKRTQISSMGHRFLVQGTKVEEIFEVTKASQTVEVGALPATKGIAKKDPPNVVVIMGDDWSWPHASIYGDPTVKTPAFDRIAREGVLFHHAFVSAPSCTPSRHAVSSGQYHWRLGQGVNLGGSIGRDVPVYPDLLAAIGYRTGFCRKGTAPSQNRFRGNDPFGKRFTQFDEFMDGQKKDDSFCFWYGAGEPHRPYPWKASKDSELDLASIEVPPFLPDNDTTRTDLGDYYLRVQQLDHFAGEILQRLEDSGELENTIVVMTGDNGMPFPRAKATLYDSGTRVPLAIRWGKQIEEGREIQDFVNLTDLAPTFLEAAGLPVPAEMTGRSLLSLLTSSSSGQIEASRDHILAVMEQHVYPNPSRSIRTADFLYIRNFAPESWPTGRVEGAPPVYDFLKTPWPTGPGAFSHNIDPGPTKQGMLQNKSAKNKQAFGLRPAEELYDLRSDPHQLVNLIAGTEIPKAIFKKRNELSRRLTEALRVSGDPRFVKPNHASFEVKGWTVHLHDDLWADGSLAIRRALELLDGQLQRVIDVVPGKALKHLREVPLWINPQYEGTSGTAEYHAQEGWLRNNGRNPEMARAVEITNVKKFPFENRRMPFLLLHELAHAYHDQVVADGYRNADLKTAYERARDSGTYDSVARFDGNKTIKDKAYGMSNPMEYFAESTEAYFGKNDFFPFNREELKQHDPLMHNLVARLWGAGK